MAAIKTVSAKITCPGFSGVIERKRLFRIFSDLLEKPVLWISSPAGSGKSKLVSSYLNSLKRPCIWYHCDEGDSDPATFFYYMGLAAGKATPHRKKNLPLLTPEYVAGMSTFTRLYFEKLYSRLTVRQSSRTAHEAFFIVLDNYQDVPEDAPFHDMIAAGLDMIPEDIRMVVISRSDPLPACRPMTRLTCFSMAISVLRFRKPGIF